MKTTINLLNGNYRNRRAFLLHFQYNTEFIAICKRLNWFTLYSKITRKSKQQNNRNLYPC